MSVFSNIIPVNRIQGDFEWDGNITITEQLNVSGDLIIQGDTLTLGETVIADPITIVNYISGSNFAGVQGDGLAGFEVDRGSLTNYQFVFNEATDMFSIGEVGDLQVVSTRADTFIVDELVIFDTPTQKFVGAGETIAEIKSELSSDYNSIISSISGSLQTQITNEVNTRATNDTTNYNELTSLVSTISGDLQGQINTKIGTSDLTTLTTDIITTGTVSANGMKITSGVIYDQDLGFTQTGANKQEGIYSLSTGTPNMFFDHRATDNNGSFTFRNGTGASNTLLNVNGDGKVGIGTNSPNAKLSLKVVGKANIANSTITKSTDFDANSSFGFNGLSNNNDGIYFGMGANGDGIPCGIGFMRENSGWNTALSFYTNNITSGPDGTNAMSEKVRITSDGKVGIGTNTPGAMLDTTATALLQVGNGTGATYISVKGGANTEAMYSVENDARQYRFGIYGDDAFGIYDDTADQTRFRLDILGNIKLGHSISGPTTTPQSLTFSNDYSTTASDYNQTKLKLYDGGSNQVYGFGVGNNADITYHSAGTHELYINGAKRVTIADTLVTVENSILAKTQVNIGDTTAYINRNANQLQFVDALNGTTTMSEIVNAVDNFTNINGATYLGNLAFHADAKITPATTITSTSPDDYLFVADTSNAGKVAKITEQNFASTYVKKYSIATVGNGSTNPIVISHGLGTRDVVVSVRDNSTHALVIVDAVATTVDTVTLTFTSTPTTNQYSVKVIG